MPVRSRSKSRRNAAQIHNENGDAAVPFLTLQPNQITYAEKLKKAYEAFHSSGLEYRTDTLLGHLLDGQANARNERFYEQEVDLFIHLCNGGRVRTPTGCVFSAYTPYKQAYCIANGYDRVIHRLI